MRTNIYDAKNTSDSKDAVRIHTNLRTDVLQQDEKKKSLPKLINIK